MNYKDIRPYVLTGAGSSDVKKWLVDEGIASGGISQSLGEANLVVFTGGSDVTPSLYEERNVHASNDWLRDVAEEEVFDFCRFSGVPMLGICRGSQFLHVMMGGKLWQDVTDHCCQHPILDLDSGLVINDTTSTHHQMVRTSWVNGKAAEDSGFRLIATPTANRSKHYKDHFDTYGPMMVDPHMEVEAYQYQKDGTSIMGIQGHPEWGGAEFSRWAAERVKGWLLVAEPTCHPEALPKVKGLEEAADDRIRLG